MSTETAAMAAPTPSTSSTLAPPSNPARPTSAASSRSGNSSRRGRGSNNNSSSNGSANVSRQNSANSGNSTASKPKTGDRVKKSGNTTTISGGTSLGSEDAKKKTGKAVKGKAEPSPAPAVEGKSKSKPALGRKNSTKPNRPDPIKTASTENAQSSTEASKSASESLRSIHAPVSAPLTAMEAAVNAATKKHTAMSGGDALSSLQKMITDLKAISPASGGSSNGLTSRSISVGKDLGAQATPKTAREGSSPVPIPNSATSVSSKKLQPTAPEFTPSFSSVSPVRSALAISPVGNPPQVQQRATSTGKIDRRMSNSPKGNNGFNNTTQPGYNAASQLNNPITNLSMYHNQLAVHPEAENEDLSPLSFAQHSDAQFQQQQLVAQMQYQQMQQLLQAQMAAVQPRDHTSHQSMSSFMAPRFQALAAQRAQQQQLAQMYELQQQQIQQQIYQQQQEAQAREAQLAQAEQDAYQSPAVFEEDSPEPRHSVLGPTGRPQLAPTFTFGTKPRQTSEALSAVSERVEMSPQLPAAPVVVNRSEGIGGAAATGLAGLAARAHRRTGSELTPAAAQQMELQRQIEALQAEQRALVQQDLASHGISSLNAISSAFGQPKETPSQSIARHRRVQSSMPASTSGRTEYNAQSSSEILEEPQPRQVLRGLGDMAPPPVPSSVSSHSRRHSVNVFNKTAGTGAGFGSFSSTNHGDIPEDGPANGSMPQPGHQRSSSRSGLESGNWRMNGAPGASVVSDLAAAQAQLQSLAQFRAAAGGGHAKMASFAFPNMLPNLLAATTLQGPPGQSLWQQQQAFQMQLQQTSQGPQRKSLFAPYLPQASLPPLLSAGKLVVGVLRVNKKNRSDAYVATDVLEADIYICGSKDRNRALEGDIVAVELLDVDEVWGTKKDKEEKKRKKEENAAYDFKPSQSFSRKMEKKKDDVEVEGQGLTLFDDEEVNDETKPTYAGHVVAVVERMPGQLFSGQLGVLRPSSAATKEKQELERREREGDRAGKRDEPEQRPKIVWFKPTDKRVPLIAIPTEQAPADFVENSEAYADRLFVATIKRWPITSLHPFGTLVEELGPIGDCEVETSALLKDCNFPTEDFQELTLKCLPPLPWSIPEREYEIRNDLSKERIFTIDPASAKDLDDALSFKKNEDGTFTVGVHIADVSYFVKTNTSMDRDARKRATSVYLVQRAVPMLPPQLCEELCSLVPGVERLAFSATFQLDEDGNVLEKSFERTIIKSCAKLAYADAQAVIDGKSIDGAKVGSGHAASDVEDDIKNLYDLASKLRTRRVESGAMVSNKFKVSFTLSDKGRPIDCEANRRIGANTLVEEFMLLANMTVAQIIANGLPEQSLLRRHEAPIERRLDGFVKKAHKLGYTFNPASAGTLQKSFDAVEDKDAALCLNLLAIKAMQRWVAELGFCPNNVDTLVIRARYFCTGMLDIAKYSHYALNTPLYTHFTSPIRRYADVLVHRMLDACLTSPSPNDVKFHMDRDQVAKCAQQCNMKKQSAKLAEDQSVHLYLCMLIHDLTERYGPVIREGRVTGVLDAAFDVVIPEFGIEKRVHVDKMPVENTVFDEHKDVLSLYWTKQDVLTFLAETTDDEHLLKIKRLGEQHAIGNSTSRAQEAESLFEDSTTAQSIQYQKSAQRGQVDFQGLRTSGNGHRIQDIKELMKIQVIVTADMTKSPPVLVVYACNPYAA
ncbi:protein SSD1, partial [Tremellales sp. Uapishka_1]